MNFRANDPIGIFDSGIGGLTIASKIIEMLPNESFIYFADTDRNPYGTKTLDVITKCCIDICDFLVSNNCKAIIIACNTATIAALDTLASRYKIPIIGVVQPSIDNALRLTINKKIAIMATKATILSGVFQDRINREKQNISLLTLVCQDLVELAESGNINNNIACKSIKKYTDLIKEFEADTLILACTHFPLFIKIIKKHINDIIIVDPALYVTKSLADRSDYIMADQDTERIEYHFFTNSKNIDKFKHICNSILKINSNVISYQIKLLTLP